MDLNILTYLACICFIFIIGRIFIVPIKDFKINIKFYIGRNYNIFNKSNRS